MDTTNNNFKVFGLAPMQGRWLYVPLGILSLLCLGTVYSWSIFRKPLETALKVAPQESLLPFGTLLAVFAIVMPIAGRYIEKYGPQKVAAAGGLVMGLGYCLSGLATNIPMLVVTYGIIAGAGVGITYGVPIAVAAKWFPDRKGLAVGLTVVGFGLSPLITAPLAKAAIEKNGVGNTFVIFGVTFAAIVLLVASQLKFPPASWQNPAAVATSSAPGGGGEDERLLSNPRFYVLWVCYTIGTLAGLMAIGIASDVGKEVIKLDRETATAAVSIFAIFNGIGRPIFGWLTDRLKPKNAAIVSFMLLLIASLIMLKTGEGQTTNYFIAFGLFWLCLGGWLAIAPTATLTLFSSKNYAKNYGIVFTAYGVGALLGTFIASGAKGIFGSYTVAFYPTAALAILGIIIAQFGLKSAQHVSR